MTVTGYNGSIAFSSDSAFKAFHADKSYVVTTVPAPGLTTTNEPKDSIDLKHTKRLSSAASALAFIGLGLLLNRVPAKPSAFEMVSTNIEDWVKMGLGVTAVGKINEALDWKPKPWQHGLETVSVLTFITQGLRLRGWKHFPLLAASVPALVQGTHWVSHKVDAFLDKHGSTLPRWIPKLGITLASTLGGVYGLRTVMEAPMYRSATGQLSTAEGQQMMGTEALVCSRCGGTHLVCMEEVSDFIGSMVGWLKEHWQIGKPHRDNN
jgi:hypothetical protein